MANKVIKGLTVEIGGNTTKLDKALEKVEKNSRSLSSELGQINKLLKFDPGNTELLAQKQRVLAEAVDNTAEKLDTLKEAEKQVQAQFEKGEASEEQVRALRREIIDTEKRLESYKKAAQETADALEEVDREAGDAAEGLEDVGEEAADAEEEADDLSGTLGETLAGGLKAVATAAVATAAALVGIAEESREYRTAMGKLDTAFKKNNHSAEAAQKTYEELQSVLGETDQAVEAANFLAQMATTEEELAAMTDALTGVYATFGASLPIESLAEAANETIKAGQVTGSFADSLNWVNAESKDWKKALGKNQKALKAFEKATDEGLTAEDAFNEALAACTDEQSRQRLVMDTLTSLYGDAATAYKKTNANVIAANKANEQWNSTMAKLGANVEPVVTEIKSFGAELLASAEKPLKAVATYIKDTVIPALRSIADWVGEHMPEIEATVVGLTAAFVAYKVATAAAEVVQNGLKAAILSTTVAQKALNLAAAATPWGLAAVAITGVAAALAYYMSDAENATSATERLHFGMTEAEKQASRLAAAEDLLAENTGAAGVAMADQSAETALLAELTPEALAQIEPLTAEELRLVQAASDAADAFREQKAAAQETVDDSAAYHQHLLDLVAELDSLVSESNYVRDADKARVEFITNELNAAMGLEMELVGNALQGYKNLKDEIYNLINAKTANAMLEAKNEAYITAIQEEDSAFAALMATQQDYQAHLVTVQELEAKLAEDKQKLTESLLADSSRENAIRMAGLAQSIQAQEDALEKEKGILGEKKTAYDGAAADYVGYTSTIEEYEAAQTAVLQENYEEAIDILKSKSAGFVDYAEEVDDATADVLDTLLKEAVDAGIAAEKTRKNFENGVKGYTERMVKEADEAAEDAMNAFIDASTEAEGVGKDIGDGLDAGLASKRESIISRAVNMVKAAIAAAREAADSHSPSREMMSLGEDMGEGAAIGLENTTDDLLKTARKQVNEMLREYSDAPAQTEQVAQRSAQELQAQSRRAERSLYEQGAQLQADMAGTVQSQAGILGKILTAIERGQILTIDGDALVGATADRYDSTLGQRRALAARGAL